MKKFTDITKKESSFDFYGDKKSTLSNDIDKLNDQISDNIKSTKTDGEWEIVNIIDVSLNEPNISEAVVINADLTNKVIKRGDIFYLHKKRIVL